MEVDFKETKYADVGRIYVARCKAVAGCCECGCETADPIKYVAFLEKVGDHWTIKKITHKFPLRGSHFCKTVAFIHRNILHAF
jgi:hypothetical protein